MNSYVLLGIACVVMLMLNSVNGQWFQVDGNAQRSRSSGFSYYRLAPHYTTFPNIAIIPNTFVMNAIDLSVYGLAQQGNDVDVIRVGNDGYIYNFGTVSSDMFGVLDSSIAPLLDSYGNYYTARRNNQTNTYYVLKTLLHPTRVHHEIVFDTMSNNQIQNMVITSYGLIVSSDNDLICIDLESGQGKWISTTLKLSKTQFLYDNMNNLFVSTTTGLSLVDLQNGFVKDTASLYSIISSYQQPLSIGTDYLATFDMSYGAKVFIFKKNNLKEGFITSTLFRRDGLGLVLDQCTNALSLNISSSSFFIVCRSGSDLAYSAFRFDITDRGTLQRGYQIDFSSLFGMPVKFCSNQIAATGNDRYSIMCDAGLISFGYYDNQLPRQHVMINVNYETQSFGTVNGNFIGISPNYGNTHIQFF